MVLSEELPTVHPTHQYLKLDLTSNSNTGPHPLHASYCWCHPDCSGAKELHQHYHVSLFSSMKATYLQAIKAGYLWGCNGLTYKGTKWHITGSKQATVQVHLKQCWQGIWSTKNKPTQQKDGQQHFTYMTIFAPGQIITDQMGWFPI